jgi:mannose-6-phosphate isomerase-like protein (cupin superfamily)
LEKAKYLGNTLIVVLNSDECLARKKGRAFMTFNERREVLYNLYMTDLVTAFDDSDGSACELLKTILDGYSKSRVVFANGGDRTAENIPEMRIQEPRLEFRFGIGGETKQAASSDFLREWREPLWVQRPWGRWGVVDEGLNYKVKRLVIKPDSAISLQYHKKRGEHWTVVQGTAVASLNGKVANYGPGDTFHVPVGQLHRVYNNGGGYLVCIEVQYGICEEEDIVRV